MTERNQSTQTLEPTAGTEISATETAVAIAAAADAQPGPSLPATLRRIILTGFMGSGKSTIGRLLAERLGWSFLDLDNLISSRSGLSVADIFTLHGEDHFRRLESTALAIALGRPTTVIALGGGTPESLTNRLLLEQTPATVTILLDAPFPTLFDRCVLQALQSSTLGSSNLQQSCPDLAPTSSQNTVAPLVSNLAVSRPVFADPAQAEARFNLRQPLYRRLAHHTVATDAQSPEETAATIAALLHR